MVKPSRYNHYIPLEKGEYILVNTLSGDMLIIDEDTRSTIENIQQTEADLSGEILEQFKLNHLVVQDNENELLYVRDRYNAKCYNTQVLSFFLTPTANCNLSCPYCWQRIDTAFADKSAQTATMSASMVKGVLLFIKKRAEILNVKHMPIAFFGGEPLVEKELVLHMLEELAPFCEERSINMEVGLYTNCTLLDQPFIDNLNEYTVGYVRAGLDGPQHIHDQYRFFKDGKGTYDVVMKNIGELRDAGIKVIVQYNITRDYVHAPELFDDLTERGLKDVIVDCHRIYDPACVITEVKKAYGQLDESVSVPQSTFALPFEEVNKAKMYIYRCAFKKGFSLRPPKLGLFLPCRAAQYYEYIVDPLGYVYKCSTSMLIKDMRVGHIDEHGKFERFPFLHEWMNDNPTYFEECQACNLLPSCGGGCLLGRKLAQRPFLCEVSQFPEEDYIKMYLKQQYPEDFSSVSID